jgi:hypothetical protein
VITVLFLRQQISILGVLSAKYCGGRFAHV